MHIRGYQRPVRPRRSTIPIYVASVGPHMTRLAGEVADGWIAHELGSPDYLRARILPSLTEGIEGAGRRREDVAVVASACCVPHPDGARARRWAAGLVAFYATVRTYEPFFEWHGFLDEARAVQAAFRAGDHEGMVAAVPEAMVARLTIAGTVDEVRAGLARYEGLADRIKLSPPTHFVPADVTAEVQDAIIDLVAAT
jgi:alkanesulfonate monooxygenase SsuD/methylene tetrahydromethanopterin reductase-like flavin-dependent oxidoreductase (luciferase family)